MSIAVPLADLAEVLTGEYDAAFLLTVSDDGRPHAVSLIPEVVDGGVRFVAGGRTCRNASVRPSVSMVFPAVEIGGFSLVVDGDAAVDGDAVTVTPTWAVRHRPAPR